MTYYARKSIPERLMQASTIIRTVAVDESIRQRLARKGYKETEFSEMLGLLESAQRHETNQQIQLGRQTAATKALKALTKSMLMKFVGDRKIVRHVLKGDPALFNELRLHIKTQKSKEALIRQMSHFYEEVVKHSALMERLASEFNLTAVLLRRRLEDVGTLMNAFHTQQYQAGQYHMATRDRQVAMKKLDTWMSGFIGFARQAFRGEEEYLAKLSIHVKRKPDRG